MHAYWRAANYLSVGQIYLQDNPLLETPLKLEHIKPRLLVRGYGYDQHFVEGHDPPVVHQALAGTLDAILARIREIRSAARTRGATKNPQRPRWPMIVFRTPKGWTGPKFVDGKPVEGTWRAHQVPIADFQEPGTSQATRYISEHGEDMPGVRDWRWPS
jgi:phosphoketolase